jgi:hypothetical protein
MARVRSTPAIEGGTKGAPATASAAGILTVARGQPHVKRSEPETRNPVRLTGAHEQM